MEAVRAVAESLLHGFGPSEVGEFVAGEDEVDLRVVGVAVEAVEHALVGDLLRLWVEGKVIPVPGPFGGLVIAVLPVRPFDGDVYVIGQAVSPAVTQAVRLDDDYGSVGQPGGGVVGDGLRRAGADVDVAATGVRPVDGGIVHQFVTVVGRQYDVWRVGCWLRGGGRPGRAAPP